jgi:transcription elongation GreA/GreB family factor
MSNKLETILNSKKNGLVQKYDDIIRKKNESMHIKAVASEEGDLSENNEYHEADKKIGLYSSEAVMVSRQIESINEFLNMPYVSTGFISVKSSFQIRREDTGETYDFILVIPSAGDATQGLIPTDSALGAAVEGKRAGDKVYVNTGLRSYYCSIISVDGTTVSC